MPLRIDNGKHLQKYKGVSTKIEDFKNIKLKALPVYDDRYYSLQSFLLIIYLYTTKIKQFRQLCL